MINFKELLDFLFKFPYFSQIFPSFYPFLSQLSNTGKLNEILIL